MPDMLVHTAFHVLLSVHDRKSYGVGLHENVPHAVADHWWTQKHAKIIHSTVVDEVPASEVVDAGVEAVGQSETDLAGGAAFSTGDDSLGLDDSSSSMGSQTGDPEALKAERDAIRARLTELGAELPHHATGIQKLREVLATAESNKDLLKES